MTGLIIAAGVLGSLYLAILINCVMLEFDRVDFEIKSLRSIVSIVLDGFKTSLIVFFWVLVGVAGLFAMLTPLALSLYFCGFFN